jgi:hypothetical protein
MTTIDDLRLGGSSSDVFCRLGRGGRLTVFLSGMALGAFALAVVVLLTISVKTRGGDA